MKLEHLQQLDRFGEQEDLVRAIFSPISQQHIQDLPREAALNGVQTAGVQTHCPLSAVLRLHDGGSIFWNGLSCENKFGEFAVPEHLHLTLIQRIHSIVKVLTCSVVSLGAVKCNKVRDKLRAIPIE